jgi:hypothetical protein
MSLNAIYERYALSCIIQRNEKNNFPESLGYFNSSAVLFKACTRRWISYYIVSLQ